MIIFSFFIFIVALFILFFNFLVYFKNRNSYVNLSFAFFGLSIFFWLFCYGFGYLVVDTEIKLYLFRIGYIGVMLIPITFLNFTLNLIGLHKKQSKYLKYLYFLVFLILLQINFSEPGFLSKLILYNWGYYPAATPILHPLLLSYFVTLFSFSITFLFLASFTNFYNLNTVQKIRVKYVFFGSLTGILGSLDFIGSYNIPKFFPIGFLFMVPYPLILGYAIIKHRLMDINLAITRSGIFISVYSIVLGIPLSIAFGLKDKLISLVGVNWWIIPLLSSTLLATIGPFVYLFFDQKAENRLLYEQKRYHDILKNASRGMIRIKNLGILTKLIVYMLAKTVKIKHAAIYLFEQENQIFKLYSSRMADHLKENLVSIDSGTPLIWQLSSKKAPIVTEEVAMKVQEDTNNFALSKLHDQLHDLQAALAVPSFIEDRLIGILVLGEKRSGKIYSQDDINVFSVLANQAALAIENAQFYDEIKRTHEQLFQAEKMATIGTMADGLSHQINNRFHALSLIAGDSLDILKTFDNSGCNDEAKQYLQDLKNNLERIEANVVQGGEVVKGLLKYSRPGESGFEQIDLKDVLNGAIDMVQYKIRIKEIDLVQNIPADFSKFYGNLTQLQEVFFNLIDNAFDAIKERQTTLKGEGYKGKIEISAVNLDGNIEITVHDNGIGVKDVDKKKLFTPFFTTKATAKKGTGLGLYVIEKIIATHNGKLNMKSIYQSGTTFKIILPIAAPAAT